MDDSIPDRKTLKSDFVAAWRSGQRTSAEMYVLSRLSSVAPNEVSADVLADLLAVEMTLRLDQATHEGILEAEAEDEGSKAMQPCRGNRESGVESELESAADEHDRKQIGRYVVRDVLGKGGFGIVYRAWDPFLRRDVAIKMLRSNAVADRAALEREAQILSSLDHPHIVPVMDFGWDDDGGAYIVSRYVPVENLRIALTRERPSFSRAATVCATLARALHHAHARGVVHRDIKPANILVERSGHVWLTDFGLGLSEFQTASPFPEAGTPSYMSPEQFSRGENAIDSRSDTFSLGIVLYEMLVGVNPYQAKSLGELKNLIVRQDVKPCRLVNERVPRKLEEICLRAMRRSPHDRFSVALDFAEALESAITYRPKPINVSNVKLPVSLEQISETLAKNTHDVWACQRIAEDWQVGDARNDELKIHPDLVPYEELSEGEKQYDRKTVENTLKAIIAMGFSIGSPDE